MADFEQRERNRHTPPDGYKLAIERGRNHPTYTSTDPNDGYAQAIAKRQKETR
jgi:hypothetical protein